MTEFDLIQHLFNHKVGFDRANLLAPILKGIGDDAAVIEPKVGQKLLLCSDTLVQGRHFCAEFEQILHQGFAIGYKSVAVNVSDLAAMGGMAHSILLALALPKVLANTAWLTQFARGIFFACRRFGVALIGGDTTQSDQLVITVSAQGFANRAVYRSGAQVGDGIFVSGTLGDAGFALKYPQFGADILGEVDPNDDFFDGEKNETKKSAQAFLQDRLHLPTPRVHLGRSLANFATAMIDISDGLVQDLGHICHASGVQARLDLDRLPTSWALAQADLADRLLCQLTGGDDYELLFTLPSGFDLADFVAEFAITTPIRQIGQIVGQQIVGQQSSSQAGDQVQLFFEGKAVTVESPKPFAVFPNLKGYQHFE